MEDTSKQNDKLSRRDVAYYRRRQQNRLFAQIASFFAEEAANGRITRKEIADKLSKNPSQITRWFSGPSNFEMDTLSDILLTMGAELDHRIVKFSDRSKPNFSHPLTSHLKVITFGDAPSPVTSSSPSKHTNLPTNNPAITAVLVGA
jgi:hypothetical protein